MIPIKLMIQFGGDTPIAVLQGYDEVNITISPGGVIKFTDGTKEFKLYVQMDNITDEQQAMITDERMLWDETIDAQAKHADDYMKSNCSDFAQWTWQVVVAGGNEFIGNQMCQRHGQLRAHISLC